MSANYLTNNDGLVAERDVLAPNKRGIKPIASEQDIHDAKPLDHLKCGGGLYLSVNGKGDKYFQVRLSIDGKSTTRRLGKFPRLDLAQAREVAEKYNSDLAKARQKKRKAAFNKDLIKPKPKTSGESAKFPCFLNTDDVRRFIGNLSSSASLSEEIKFAIWLQILIPSRPSELLCAKWSEFDLNYSQWMVVKKVSAKPKKGNYYPPQFEYLSPSALGALQDLYVEPGRTEYIFPELSRLTERIREEKIAQGKQMCGLSYPFDFYGFREFFRAMACRDSCFLPEFIDAVIAHKDGKGSVYNNVSYNPQRRALAEWWGSEMAKLREPKVSWT